MREASVPPRGAASLVVVMVLFFVMMMAAVFNSRSLIFEQKTSANQYRYTQAFEAAEAGVQWALTMLNGRPINLSCDIDPSQTTFRDRYLDSDPRTGRLIPVADVTAGCVKTDAGWHCSCPSAGAAAPTAPTGDRNRPAFTVQFSVAPQSGMVWVKARGCSSFGSQCIAAAAQRSDAYVEIDSLLSMAGGLRTPPSAVLSVHDGVTLTGGTMRFTNLDVETQGITINAGDVIDAAAHLTSTPGSVGTESIVERDSSLGTLDPGKVFVTFFGLDKETFQRLGSVRRITCAADCASDIQAAYLQGYRMVWVDGNLIIGGSAVVGTSDDPMLLATDGNVQLAGSAQVYGVVYSGAGEWDNGPGSAVLRGAAIAEGGFRGSGSQHFIYDADVLSRLHFRTAAFTRVPGSWSDTR